MPSVLVACVLVACYTGCVNEDVCGRELLHERKCGKTAGHAGYPKTCRSEEAIAKQKSNSARYSAAYKGKYPERVKAAQKANKDKNRSRERKRTLEHDTSVRAWLAKIKLDAGCADCGYNKHAVALDFDHLPGFVKSFNIARSAWKARHLLEAEVAKCEVVCANCHRIRSYNRLMEKLRNES